MRRLLNAAVSVFLAVTNRRRTFCLYCLDGSDLKKRVLPKVCEEKRLFVLGKFGFKRSGGRLLKISAPTSVVVIVVVSAVGTDRRKQHQQQNRLVDVGLSGVADVVAVAHKENEQKQDENIARIVHFTPFCIRSDLHNESNAHDPTAFLCVRPRAVGLYFYLYVRLVDIMMRLYCLCAIIRHCDCLILNFAHMYQNQPSLCNFFVRNQNV